MKKIDVSEFKRSELVKALGDCNVNDFDEVGVYRVWIGSRGYVEEIEFVGKEKVIDFYESDDEVGGDLDYDEFDNEFVGVYSSVLNGKEVWGVSLFEELGYEYFYVSDLD